MKNAQDVKDKYPPTWVLERLIGLEPVSRGGRWTRYQYGDGRPALCACDDTQRIVDHHGHAISPWGENSTDVIGFVQTHFGVGFVDAMNMITGGVDQPSFQRTPKKKKIDRPSKPTFPLKWLVTWAKNLQRSRVDYLIERKISPSYAWKTLIGYSLKKEKGVVTLDDGSQFQIQNGWRFVFPYLYTKPVYNLWRVAQRLDTELSRKAFRAMSPETQSKLLRNFEDEDEVIDRIWRSKYLFNGPKGWPFQYWQVQKYVNGEWTIPRTKLVLATESQIDAINLYEHTGIPSVSTKNGFQCNSDLVLYVKDNDEAGDEHANKFVKEMADLGQLAEIIQPFDNFNDVNDMARADALYDWLKSNNLPTRKVNYATI